VKQLLYTYSWNTTILEALTCAPIKQ
jgi:hypothetical protein